MQVNYEDKERRNLQVQNTKQKKIVFGEQPDTFSARSLKFGSDEVVETLSDESVQEDV
jgi:hypothetical protein